LSKPATTSSMDWMRIWMRRGLCAIALWPLSMLFRALVAVRRIAYGCGILKSARLPVPVIVVGNIFVGGTGKTPMTIWLVAALRRAGFRPGVISRGYGAKGQASRTVAAMSDPRDVGDEPLLIMQNTHCPVTVGRDRVAAAQALLASNPEVNVVISDDGLQHYALKRDVEIVLFDGRGAGNGWMLPAGPLREPLSRRRDFTVINGSNYPAPDNPICSGDIFLMRLEADSAEQLMDRSRNVPLTELSGNAHGGAPRIAAAAGIGNPARFFSTLRAARLEFEEIPLPDHFDFTATTFANVEADIILVTEKDAVKCARIDALARDPRIWVVPAKANIEAGLEQKIVEKCREYRIA